MIKRLLVALGFGVLALGSPAVASAAEVAPVSLSATADPVEVSWPDSPETVLKLAVESGPDGADFRFAASPEGWGIEGVEGNPLHVGPAELAGAGNLASEQVLIADPTPTACFRGGFQSIHETFRLTLPANSSTSVEIPVRALGAPLAGMNSAVDVEVMAGEDSQTYRTEIPLTGREGVLIVGTVEGTEGQSVSRRPWQPLRVVGQTFPPVKHARIVIRAEPRRWAGKPGKTGTHRIVEAMTRKDGSFRTNLGYLASRGEWRLIAKSTYWRDDDYDPTPSCLPLVKVSGRDYDAGLTGNKVPRVKDLLNRSFISVKATGDPVLKHHPIEMSFFMHSTNPSLPKKPTISVWAGCNYWGTKFRIRRGKLFSTGETGSTAMGCEYDPDTWLIKTLDEGLMIRGKGKRLILSRPDKGIRIVLRRYAGVPGRSPKPKPKVPKMKQLIDKSYKSIKAVGNPLIEDKTIYFEFFKGASNPNQPKRPGLSVYAGCNHWGSKAAIRDGRLFTYGRGASTAMGCEDETDSWLSAQLRRSVKIAIVGKRLILTRPSENLKIVLARTKPPNWWESS